MAPDATSSAPEAQPAEASRANEQLLERDKAIRKLRESLERERNARAQMESKYKAASEKVSLGYGGLPRPRGECAVPRRERATLKSLTFFRLSSFFRF